MRAPGSPPAARDLRAEIGGGRSRGAGSGVARIDSGRTSAARWLPGLALAALLSACWRVGEPVSDAALVTWAAYPDTVVVGETFSFEMAGPVAPNTCGHLDSASLAVTDSVLLLSARRRVFEGALCTDQPVSFYEARSMTLERPGTYAVRTAQGRDLGRMVVLDSGSFSPMRTVGWGTLREAGGCLFFGPGWASNQRPFALRNADQRLRRLAGTDSVVWIDGRLAGFLLCGGFGSRPSIRVDSSRTSGRTTADYYDDVIEEERR